MGREQKIIDAIHATIDVGEIKYLAVDDSDSIVTVIVETPMIKADIEKAMSRAIAKVVKLDFGYKGLKLSIEQVEEKTPEIASQTRYITITSGKGGVGKSTVAGNLAVAMVRLGKKVGIIDADIYGPSLPKLFNITTPKLLMNERQRIIPMMTNGVAMISTEFLTEDDTPLMWRGPMLSRMLGHFFEDVLWEDDLDYIIVDLPPGTGDVPLDLNKFIPEAKTIVVTTPNIMASHIAIKSGLMAQHLGHDILGVVENMSYFTNPANGDQEKIFGAGGGEAVAERLNTEVLAQIPIAGVKEGKEGGIFSVHEENGIAYLGLANKVMRHLS